MAIDRECGYLHAAGRFADWAGPIVASLDLPAKMVEPTIIALLAQAFSPSIAITALTDLAMAVGAVERTVHERGGAATVASQIHQAF